jgi:hypothetical protein
MSLRQTQATRHKERRMRSLPDTQTLHPNYVLSIPAWCALNGFSVRTGRRIRASGDGPVVTQLSPNRIGITVANNARWQRSRGASQRRRARADQPDLHAE